MAKDKISDYSSTANSNTDIAGINIDEGCAPSGINDAIRTLMAQLKNFQTGTGGDSFNGPFAGTTIAATDTTDASSTTAAAMKTAGGLAVAKKAYIGLDANIYGLTVGRGAGSVSTNTAVGALSLNANTTGARNTALGNLALAGNTTTTYSDATAIGYNALYQGGGGKSTAVGAGALSAENASGGTNVGVGYNALTSDSSGGSNVAVGAWALQANTTASNNTAVGYQAAYSNTTGTPIQAFGKWALYANTTGTNNDAFGFNALGSNTTGGSNVGLGTYALYSNTTASYSTAVGYQAGYSTTTGFGANTFLGYQAGYNVTTGYYNTFVGQNAGYYITTGYKNTILGSYNGNQGGLDIRTASNYIVLSDGDGNPRALWDSNGYMRSVGVYNQAAAGSANVIVDSTGNIYRSTSALKYKTDVRDLESIDINLFRPVRYKSNCAIDDPTLDHFGVIADEVHDAGLTELVSYGVNGEVEGFQYERLTVVLLKSLQSLKAEFDAYKEAHP